MSRPPGREQSHSTTAGALDLVEGLWEVPQRPHWEPGGGGLCLHTVLPDPADPQRMWMVISTGGLYRSDGTARLQEDPPGDCGWRHGSGTTYRPKQPTLHRRF